MTIGERIRYLRTQMGITQEELARRAELHPVSIRKYETNKRVPQMPQARKLAAALGVDLQVLLKDVEFTQKLPLKLAAISVANVESESIQRDVEVVERKDSPCGVAFDKTSFGERLKELRTIHNFNQREFAQQVGISQPTLSCYEKGTALPSIEVLVNVATEFHVSLDWLFGLSDNQFTLSTVGDVAKFLFDLDEFSDLRFEIDIEESLSGDSFTEGNNTYAAIKFCRNDNDHPFNEIMFDFLSEFKENRRDFETYFISKKMYDLWKDYAVKNLSNCALSKKEYEPLSEPQRISRRDSLLLEEALRSKETKLSLSDQIQFAESKLDPSPKTNLSHKKEIGASR